LFQTLGSDAGGFLLGRASLQGSPPSRHSVAVVIFFLRFRIQPIEHAMFCGRGQFLD
jgi:hypothetical protein